MTNADGWLLPTSPFHPGEIAAQERVGVADKMGTFARRVVRPYLTDQLRAFYTGLNMVFVGHVDQQGQPWASVIAGKDGFINSPDPETLTVDAQPAPGDPLADALKEGSQLGLVGIGLGNRRRNRVNGIIARMQGDQLTIAVEQAFGNCPQYIRPRSNDTIVPSRRDGAVTDPQRFTTLDAAGRELIKRSETFFVASYSRGEAEAAKTNGVDVSHRGGKPGFVSVDENVLTIPDFAGNFHFNTLGNFLVEPRAGLLFVDWQTGRALMLTGTVEIIWEGPEVQAFRGAERLWRFSVTEGLWLEQVVAPSWDEGEPSPNSLITGDWEDAAATLAAQEKRAVWRPFRVARIEDESSVIRSFYLEPTDDAGLIRSEAGQHISVRVPIANGETAVRSYTLSSSPSDPFYRISVKREDARGDNPAGVVSTHLHRTLSVGDGIDVRAPGGSFVIDTTEPRPAVLIAGGVGITPMISMARDVAHEGLRTRHARALTIIHATRSVSERAFAEDFRRLQDESGGTVRYVSIVDHPETEAEVGRDFDHRGRVDAQLLKQLLSLDDYDFFLCGPPPFMQAIYTALRDLGVRDKRIFAEAFGPASLQRVPDEAVAPAEQVPEADEAVVAFTQSGFEQRWSKGDATLLELAEAHGLSPAYGCRSGSCGSCAVRVAAGSVTYRSDVTADVADDEALICCAVPASGSDRLELEL